jgi:hypothetical protein
VRTPPERHDWDFFYRSLQAAPELRPTILAKMCSGTTPVFKSELRPQRATTLSERIGKKQHAMQAAIRKQRNVNDHAGERSKPNARRAQPPRRATRHSSQVRQRRDRDHRAIGRHRPLRGPITPDNCSTSLISVDQIFANGHTVTFSATETIITDDNDRYRLTYPRVTNSREWTVPMQAMEDLSRFRQNHPLRRN